MEDAKATTPVNEDIAASKLRNEEITTQLHFDLLKQYAWLSSAGIGAMIVLIQLKVMILGPETFISLGMLGGAVITAVFGQDYLVDSLSRGKTIYEVEGKIKFYRYPSLALFGAAMGSVSVHLIA